MSFKITKYTPLNSDGNTIGFLSFTIEKTGMFFNDCRVIRRGNGEYFVAAPSRPYEGEDGCKRYMAYWGFETREVGEKFQQGLMQAVRAYWEELKKENQTQQPPPQNSNYQPQAPQNDYIPEPPPFDDSECPF